MMLVHYGVAKNSYSFTKYDNYLRQDQQRVKYYYSVSQFANKIDDHYGRSHVSEKTYIMDLISNDGKQRRVGMGGIRAYSKEHEVVHIPYSMITYYGRGAGDNA